jgi:hypothetical protein
MIKNIITKTAIFMALFTIIFFTYGNNIKAAGNYKDERFYQYYNGDGSDVFTPFRAKLDYTSSYSYNNRSTYGYTANVYGDYTKYGSGIGTYCTYGTPRHLSVGQAKYLPNLVKERGYNYAQIGMMSDSHNPSIFDMLWSPDSI